MSFENHTHLRDTSNLGSFPRRFALRCSTHRVWEKWNKKQTIHAHNLKNTSTHQCWRTLIQCNGNFGTWLSDSFFTYLWSSFDSNIILRKMKSRNNNIAYRLSRVNISLRHTVWKTLTKTHAHTYPEGLDSQQKQVESSPQHSPRQCPRESHRERNLRYSGPRPAGEWQPRLVV